MIAAPVAEAKSKKSKKKRRKKAKRAKVTKTKAAPSSQEAPARTGAASFRIESGLDAKEIARSREADRKRDEAIEQLKKLIPRAPEGRKAEMIFRLAELYWEKSKFKYGIEMASYEKQYEEWVSKGRKGKEPKRQRFIRESELIKGNALKLYEKVLVSYPKYHRNDEVLFYLGYNEYEAGNRKKAVQHYWTLIKQFPKSRLVADAYLQLGEHFFESNNVLKARKAYERALKTKVPRVYNYALYKLAWCDYNMQEYADGIRRLKEVINNSETSKDRKTVQLKSEALADLALYFSHVDEVESAFAYFKKKGGETLAHQYTRRLGGLFDEQGKWSLAIKSYRLLNNKYPLNPKAPEIQSRIVQSYSKLNKRTKVRQEVERLVDLYRPGTRWYRAQEDRGDKDTLEYAYDLTETNLRDLVTEYHRDAQKRKDVPTYRLARDIYAKYLTAFTDTEAAYSMRYFYAEVLWALKEWKNSALEYDRVARTKTEDKAKAKYALEASYNAILAWERIVAEGDKGKVSQGMRISEKKKKGKVENITRIRIASLDKNKTYAPEPIPEVEQKLSNACDLYFKMAKSTDSELPAIKFKAAYIYYKHNQFTEAASRYNEIIERWPKGRLAKRSAHLILDSLNVQKQWDELEKYARGFRSNARLVGRDKKFAEEVQVLIEGAAYKSIQVADAAARKRPEAEQRAPLAAVATRFRKFQEEFPASKYADKALFSSVLIYNKAGELDHALEASKLFKRTYEKSELRARNDLLLAEFHQKLADYDQAATLYAAFYEDHPGHKRGADALYNAGAFFHGIGDYEQALKKFNTYLDKFKKRDDLAEVYWRVCDIHAEQRSWKKAEACFDAFGRKHPKAGAAKVFESKYRAIQMLAKQGKGPAVMRRFKGLAADYKKLPAKAKSVPAVQLAGAHAAFSMLRPEFDSYMKMKVTLNRKTLQRKQEALLRLACIPSETVKCKAPGRFLSVLSYGNGDYGIAALTRIGETYREMANALRSAPIPRRLTEEQVEIYRAELESLALGPEEKGIEAFESALKKAYELNIYNRWTLRAQENLKALQADRYPDLQKRSYRGAESFIVASVRAPSEEPAPAAAPAGAGE